MADELQKTLLKGLKIENDSSDAGPNTSQPVIPILERSQYARATSQKLSSLSPICILVVGMAGSGKTTLMSALQRSVALLGSNNEKEVGGGTNETMEKEEGHDQNNENDDDTAQPVGYCLNLDPATKLVPFGASIDIRDTIDYKVSIPCSST